MQTPAVITGVIGMAISIFAASGDDDLAPKVVEEPGFIVVEISARTTNAKEMSGQGIIGKQWQRFMEDGLLGTIPNRADSNILALYTDYESGASGAYTFVLGGKVSSAETVPSGMVVKKVPAGKYALFTSSRGPASKVVPETWAHIWSLPKSTAGGDRSYRADFERYDERATDPQNAQVDIYVGIN